MKRIALFCLVMFFMACGSSRNTYVVTTKKEAQKRGYSPVTASRTPLKTVSPVYTASKTVKPAYSPLEAASTKVQDIIDTAISYKGTRYKYGGTSRSGMDCSGLIYTTFLEHNISLQRSSYLMATQGKPIERSQARPGDLLFFITGKDKSRISHVGLVVAVEGDNIKFVHASTSKGVTISSIHENYWNKAFAEARNIL